MLKKLLTIITLCTTLTLHATPGVSGEPIDDGTLQDIVYTYDNLNRVTKATYASGESMVYTYDAGGNLLGVVFDDPNVLEKPNLAFYKDDHWDSLFVINPNTPINNQPYNEEQVYLSEGIAYGVQYINESNVRINTGNQNLLVAIVYLDGNPHAINRHDFGTDSYLTIGYKAGLHGYISQRINTIGSHTLKIVLDPDNKIDESDETDNVLEKTFYVFDRKNENINNFVKRFYAEVLGRNADQVGLDSWVETLSNGSKSGGDIAKGFILSEEFEGKELSNIEFLEILYKAFFNREADIDGLSEWLYQLEEGVSRADVLDGFLGSKEFNDLADRYGIVANITPVENFVTRFYEECLLRTPDKDGLNYWVAELKDGTKTGADIARGFIWSTEFIDRALDDSEYLEVLYKAFFNREADTNGYNYWMDDLYYGKTRNNVLEGFLGAQEFIKLSNIYGIKPF